MSIDNFFVLSTVTTRGTKVRCQRPNNTTAYAPGAVYGAAVDARLELVVPSLPAIAYLEYFTSYVLKGVQFRDPSAQAVTLLAYLSSEPFETILGDGDPLVLSDDDIARVVQVMVALPTGLAFVSGNAGALAIDSGTDGRRAARQSSAFEGGMHDIVPGATLGLYLAVQAAYTPAAEEIVDIYPQFAVQARLT